MTKKSQPADDEPFRLKDNPRRDDLKKARSPVDRLLELFR